MIREAHVNIDGRRTRYLEAGEGPPVVLLHAFPLSADMWRPQLDDPPDGWRLVAPDLRGFGPSTRIGAPEAGPALTIDDFARDVEAFLSGLGIERAVIGGLSMGGYVTFALLRRAPARFSGVVLADTRPQADTEEGREGRRKMRALVLREGASAVADQMLPKLLGPTTLGERPAVVSLARQLIEVNAPHAITGALDALMERPDSTADLPRIAVPTLVVVGDEDTVTPIADAELMHDQIPRSALAVIPGAGHLSNLEVPDAFSKALAGFLLSHF